MRLLICIFQNILSKILMCPVFAESSFHKKAVQYAIDQVEHAMNIVNGIGQAMVDVFGASGESSWVGQIDIKLTEALTGSIMPIMSGLGLAIAVLCWIISVVELVIQDRISPETFVKSFARIGLAVVLCDLTTEIFEGIKEFGNQFASTVGSVAFNLEDGLGNGWKDSLDKALKNTFFLSIYIDATVFIAPTIILSVLVTAVTYIVSISRLIEMNVRGAFLGVAFGMLADDGWRGAGGRYIRKFVAICAQGGVLILVGKIGMEITGFALKNVMENVGSMTDIMNGLIISLGCCVACVSVMFKSIGIVNDVFGA